MTTPTSGESGPDQLPDVDRVIQEARKGSWHLPATPPSEPVSPGHTGDMVTPTAPAAAVHTAPAAPPASTAPAPAATPAAPASGGHASDAGHGAATTAHGTADAHGAPAAHGAHDGGHDEAALGPVDVEMWGAGIVAALVGLLITIGFVLATAGAGAY